MIYEVTLILIIIVAININNDEIILIIVTDKLIQYTSFHTLYNIAGCGLVPKRPHLLH